MVNNHIRVYARIRKEGLAGHKSRYEVLPDDTDDYDIMKIYQSGTTFKRKRRAFKFNKVFLPNSTQEDVFNVIAKPIINDVFAGINATIFAYGATGSGKTYTLTGSQTKYEDRGLIPRTIEHLFKLVTDDMSNYMFFISYLEIYNENAYDLLSPKQNFTCLEELPRVIVLEDEKGEAHFKNLCLKEVNTEKEAMRLLYSGDNNRTIAETPLNDYSSRSHCVFTVHVISKCNASGNITKSKLNLVDLAGSERLHRMNLHGMTLNEARHINLSLHYLERVIQALSQKGTHHVPYRNSMMTFILRDSLGGNCLTAMLATLSMLHLNLDESITTCKFAQRVCLITLDANVNYVPNPEKEVQYLRNELKRLRRLMNEKVNVNKKLTREEEEECKVAVKQYLLGKDEFVKLNDVRKVRFYFDFMRNRLSNLTSQYETLSLKSSPSNSQKSVKDIEKLEMKYKQIIQQKDEEISILMNVYHNRIDPKTLFAPISHESLLSISGTRMDSLERKEFRVFLNNSKHKPNYDDCIKNIKVKYHEAVKVAQTLAAKQTQIAYLKGALVVNQLDTDSKLKLNLDQNFYRQQLHKMHNLRGDIEGLKLQMNKLKGKIMDDYKLWCYSGQGQNFDFAMLDRKSQLDEFSKHAYGDCKSSSSSVLTGSHPREIRDLPRNSRSATPSSKSEHIRNVKKVLVGCTMTQDTALPKVNKAEVKSRSLCSVSTESGGLKLDRSRNFLNIPSEYSSLTTQRTCKCDLVPEVPKRSNSVIAYPCTPRGDEILGSAEQEDENYPKLKIIAKGVRRITPRSHRSLKIGKCRHNVHLSMVQCKSADCISQKRVEKEEKPALQTPPSCYKFVQPGDSAEFVAYLKSIPLTGDDEVDEEIIKFYRLKYKRQEIKSLAS